MFLQIMTNAEVKTRLKVIPTILRVFLGVMSLILFTVAVSFLTRLINDQTPFVFISVLMFSFLGLFFLGLGPASIATFSFDGKTLRENVLGMFESATEIEEIIGFSVKQAANGFGAFDQIILNKRDGKTIFIESFDQINFKKLRIELEKRLEYKFDNKPNYWTRFYKFSAIYMGCLIVLMIVLWALGK